MLGVGELLQPGRDVVAVGVVQHPRAAQSRPADARTLPAVGGDAAEHVAQVVAVEAESRFAALEGVEDVADAVEDRRVEAARLAEAFEQPQGAVEGFPDQPRHVGPAGDAQHGVVVVQEQHPAQCPAHVDEVAVGADQLRDHGQQFIGEAVQAGEGGVEEQLRRCLGVALGGCRALGELSCRGFDEGRAVAAVLDDTRVELRRPRESPSFDEFEPATPRHHVVGQREAGHLQRADAVHHPAAFPPRGVGEIDFHVAATDRGREVVGFELPAHVGDQRRE